MTRFFYWFAVGSLLFTLELFWAQPHNPEEREPETPKKENPKPKPLVEMKLSIGTSTRRMFRGNTWLPLRIEITNNGKEEIQGTLVVQVEHPDSVETYETTAQLSAKPSEEKESPKKKFLVPIYVEIHGYVIQVQLRQPGKTTYVEYCDITTFSPKETYGTFLVISDQTGHLENLKLLEPFKSLLLIDYASPRQLFSSKDIPWALYDKIFLDRLLQYDLGSALYNELQQYVQNGGNLIIATGESWQGVSVEIPKPLCPAKISAFAEIFYPLEKENIPMATLQPEADTESRFLPKMSDPYLVSRALGAGNVSLLATDLNSLRKIAPQFELLQTLPHKNVPMLLDYWHKEDEQIPLRNQMLKNLEEDLSTSFKIKILEKTIVLLYLAVYLISICILPLLLFRRLNRLEFAWGAIVIVALIFFGAITKYQQKTKFRHFVGNLFTVTQLENQSSTGRSVHFLTTYSPDHASYTLQFGNETEPAYPTPLFNRDNATKYTMSWYSGSSSKAKEDKTPKETTKVWRESTFFLEKTLFWANSKRSFESQSFPKFEESFFVQIDSPETENKQLQGRWKTPYSLLQGFILLRNPKDLNSFAVASLGDYPTPNQEVSFVALLEHFHYFKGQKIQNLIEEISKIDPILSQTQKKQMQQILELFFTNETNKRAIFFGFQRDSRLHFTVDNTVPTLQKLTLILSDISANFSTRYQRVLTPTLLSRKKMERESADARLRFQIEEIFVPLLDPTTSRRKKTIEAELEISYFPQKYPVPPLRGQIQLIKHYPFSNRGLPNEHEQNFTLQVEIWNPKTKDWHPHPIFFSKENRYLLPFLQPQLWEIELPNINIFLDPLHSSLRLRYSLSMTSERTHMNLPIISIQALFTEKE